jgi:hypothetical protein
MHTHQSPQVRSFIDGAYQRTVALLREKKALVEDMAEALLKQEVLNLDAVEGLLGKRPFTSTAVQNIDRYRWVGCCAWCCQSGCRPTQGKVVVWWWCGLPAHHVGLCGFLY